MKMRSVFSAVLCVCMLLAFAACGSDDSASDTQSGTEAAASEEETIDEEYLEQPDMSVFLAIDFAEGSGAEDIGDTMIEMSKEQTVADALQLFAEAEGMEVDIDVNGNVTSIAGVSGDWRCEINGEKAADGGMSVPKDGDDVYWIMK